MEGTLEQVRLDRIDWEDQSFAVRRFAEDRRLRDSLARCGVISPPWLLAGDRGGRCIIVDGFKRLRWLREAGTAETTCLMFPAEIDRVRLLLHRLEVKLSSAQLNPAEKAQIVYKLAQVVPEDRLANEYLPLIEAPPRMEFIRRWRRLAGGGEPLLEAAARGAISERAALELGRWEPADREPALALLEILRCSASIQVEILERVREIGRRRAVAPATVLHVSELQDILGDPDRNHRQKTHQVRDLLARWRLPRLHARRDQLAEDLARAGLHPALKLTPPPAFEGDRWELLLTFTSPEELAALGEETLALARSSVLPRLMNPPNPTSRPD